MEVGKKIYLDENIRDLIFEFIGIRLPTKSRCISKTKKGTVCKKSRVNLRAYFCNIHGGNSIHIKDIMPYLIRFKIPTKKQKHKDPLYYHGGFPVWVGLYN